MRESEPPRWLLIGNSRWHWAWPDAAEANGLRVRHTPAGAVQPDASGLWAWAAVGAFPPDQLPARLRIHTDAVPLTGLPGWLGIDRALAGWLAWRRLGTAVLVADAGTVLSLTWVDAAGRFRGGRLLPGASLSLRAMAQGTAALPDPPQGALTQAAEGDRQERTDQAWPQATAAAMRLGVLRGLAAAIADAALELRGEDPALRLVLSGGDAPALLEQPLWRLASSPVPVHLPDLALAALAALRPPPG